LVVGKAGAVLDLYNDTVFPQRHGLAPFRKNGNEGKDNHPFAKIPVLVKSLVLLDNLGTER